MLCLYLQDRHLTPLAATAVCVLLCVFCVVFVPPGQAPHSTGSNCCVCSAVCVLCCVCTSGAGTSLHWQQLLCVFCCVCSVLCLYLRGRHLTPLAATAVCVLLCVFCVVFVPPGQAPHSTGSNCCVCSAVCVLCCVCTSGVGTSLHWQQLLCVFCCVCSVLCLYLWGRHLIPLAATAGCVLLCVFCVVFVPPGQAPHSTGSNLIECARFLKNNCCQLMHEAITHSISVTT